MLKNCYEKLNKDLLSDEYSKPKNLAWLFSNRSKLALSYTM